MLSSSKQYWNWGETSPKSKDFFHNSDAWINIIDGAVRSSKTITCSARWLKFLSESPHDEFLMSGKTISTLKRNVLNNFFKMLNTEDIWYHHDRYENILYVDDKTIYLMGFNDEGATDVVAGMTVGGWYGDEVTRNPKSTIEMAISRCSLPGAKMFLNMNPASPYHFLYKDYINNKDLLKAGTVKRWHFLLEDNPNLPKQYVEELIRVNKKNPLFYKRNILGQWVIAEGAIYDMFDEDVHVYNGSCKVDDMNITCDYGVSTVTTFGVIGIKKDLVDGNTYYLADETYYDAEVKGVTQSDSDRVDTIVKLQDKYHLTKYNTIFLPHDAASLKAACKKDKRIRMKVRTYTPDTYEDITTIQNLFANNRFFINSKCKHSITQAQSYCWDTRAQQRGEDKPLKIDDHCPDMWRGGILGPRKNKGTSLRKRKKRS
ncbi:PBSX family phage terminase large subunit [uncultured Methanobrevibacter sp.]|uniref:PBSX family phage terminase large subunit n=1 Tax=uncultured Methanobrevibacter sp. TaxID=253161 RepID=UPI0025CDB780|nr:PBSX family phage terminase large subunit [uncultured Methanobrevibacter sp.]